MLFPKPEKKTKKPYKGLQTKTRLKAGTKKSRKYTAVKNKLVPGAKCVICGSPACTHEIFFGNEYMKEMSRREGLQMFLCNMKCHNFNKDSVHMNIEMRRVTQVKAQMQWMIKYGKTEDDFREIFKTNYMAYETKARLSEWWDKINFTIWERSYNGSGSSGNNNHMCNTDHTYYD